MLAGFELQVIQSVRFLNEDKMCTRLNIHQSWFHLLAASYLFFLLVYNFSAILHQWETHPYKLLIRSLFLCQSCFLTCFGKLFFRGHIPIPIVTNNLRNCSVNSMPCALEWCPFLISQLKKSNIRCLSLAPSLSAHKTMISPGGW